jgi:hypothetical protein
MVVIGLVLSVVGLGFFCCLLFTLAVYALPFFALCGRPHKANYVASCDMWRRGRSMLIPSTRTASSAPHIGEAIGHARKPSNPAGGTILQLRV